MKDPFPKAQVVLNYKDLFSKEPPVNRISLINKISKDSILCEIIGLNYRLKPKDKIQSDTSFETQLKELKYFTQTDDVYKKYLNATEKFTHSKADYPILFNRQACLYAVEEIINSDEMHNIENFIMRDIEEWKAILNYLLAVNYAITQIEDDEKNNNNYGFESLNAKLLPLNELTVETNQGFTFYRGYNLLNFFLEDPEYSDEIKSYLEEKYNMTVDKFIYKIMVLYFGNNTGDLLHNFYYYIDQADEQFFKSLSKRIVNKETYKLISIKKSPFIDMGDHKYLLVDNSFLIEKLCSHFINDFWFDRIKNLKDDKGKSRFNMEIYRGKVGKFFENYVAQIMRNSFVNYTYSKLLMFDDLKIKSSKGEVEIADIYLRDRKKILLGQVKAGTIYDAEKFSGSSELLYKNNRNKFFENFGVDQLLKSIKKMDNNILKLDSNFPKGKVYEVFPCIIVFDNSFQTALMPDSFNNRFQELLKEFFIKKVTIKPLTLIHINDLERLEEILKIEPEKIWDLLKINHKDKRFAPVLYNTINEQTLGRKYPTRIMDLFKTLHNKFSD